MGGIQDDGTLRARKPIAERVLAWVAVERDFQRRGVHSHVSAEDLRRIELCALSTIEAAMFFDLYGLPSDGS